MLYRRYMLPSRRNIMPTYYSCKEWNGWSIKASPIGKRNIPIIGNNIPFMVDNTLEFKLVLEAKREDANVAGLAVFELLPGKEKPTGIKSLKIKEYKGKKTIKTIVRSDNHITKSGEYECRLTQLQLYENGVLLLTGSSIHRDLRYMACADILMASILGGIIGGLIAIVLWYFGIN